MKKLFMILLAACSYCNVFAQKTIIDTAIYGKWPSVGEIRFSNDGVYLSYVIGNHPLGNSTLVLKAVHGKWKKEWIGIGNHCFSPTSKQFIFQRGNDSLCLLTLGSDTITTLKNITSWEMSNSDNSPWLAYQLSNPAKEFVLYNTANGQKQSFEQVTSFLFTADASAVLLQKEDGNQQTVLQWVNLPGGKTTTIWQGIDLANIRMSADGIRLGFTGQDGGLAGVRQAWVYTKDDAKSIPLNLNVQDTAINLSNLSGFQFDHHGGKLFFRVRYPLVKQMLNPTIASVDVYSYKDAKLQSQQLNENHPQRASQQRAFVYVYNFHNGKPIRLQEQDEEIKSPLDGDWVLTEKSGTGDIFNEWNWNKNALIDIYLISTVDGSRKRLATGIPYYIADSYQLSTGGKYVTWYDPLTRDYYSYNTMSGTRANITKGAKSILSRDVDESDQPDSAYEAPHGAIVGWAKDDSSVWLTSRYDIFQADPEGKKRPVNLTNGYGARHHITFDLCHLLEDKTINPGKPVLLHLVNQDTKAEGFCKIKTGRKKDPEILSELPRQFSSGYVGAVVKAEDAEVYAVNVQNEKNPSNFFITEDFKKFTPLTNNQPQKAYNWLTSELVKWRTPDGKMTQGVLYKPENFDPKKKYPIIFHYYERMSGGLHRFMVPGYKDGDSIDIPTYVSNGYLIFLPDIYYKVGYPGRSALNTITSAVGYLSKFSWVDIHRMGLMGHSFGGFETDYIITHSHLFAAAASMSGMTDFVSAYGSVIGDGTSRQRQYELYRDRIGATLWQRPDLYIENSPVFKIDQVTTPVLLMANKKDGDVPYEQGFEFFTGLRRLGKKTWMLQYDHGTHMSDDGGTQEEGNADNKDLFVRTKQFFDYYLKGISPPKWMTEGVSASQKQVDSGLEHDTTGKRP